MSDELTNAIELSKAEERGGGVGIVHMAEKLKKLDLLYAAPEQREKALDIAHDWLNSGNPLMKAAVEKWVQEKRADVKSPDQMVENGQVAVTAPAATAPRHTPKMNPVVIGKLKAALRSTKHGGKQVDPVEAAYQAGHAAATKEHSGSLHRIGRMAARHAFNAGQMANGQPTETVMKGETLEEKLALAKGVFSNLVGQRAAMIGMARRAATTYVNHARSPVGMATTLAAGAYVYGKHNQKTADQQSVGKAETLEGKLALVKGFNNAGFAKAVITRAGKIGANRRARAAGLGVGIGSAMSLATITSPSDPPDYRKTSAYRRLTS